jgi:hypothetical protein
VNGNEALAIRGPNGAAPAAQCDPETFIVPGMENVKPDELRIPILQLVQAQSRVDGAQEHLGEWHNSVTGEFNQYPELLIIGVAKGRIMFPATYNADNKPLCASDDGIFPRADFVGTIIETVAKDEHGKTVVNSDAIPAKCDGCPFGAWGENSEPPACAAVAIFAGVEQEGLPVLMQIKSTGMKNVASLKTLVATSGIRKAVRVGSLREQNDTGIYYVPVFTLGQKPDKEWQKTAMRIAALGNLAARNSQAVMESDENSAPSQAPNDTWDGAPENAPTEEVADFPF